MWCLLSTCWLIMSYHHYRHTADYWMVTVKQQRQLVLTCWDKVISYKSMSSHQQQIFMQVDFKVKYNTLPVFTNIPETFWDVGDWNGVGGHVLSHKAYWWYFGSNIVFLVAHVWSCFWAVIVNIFVYKLCFLMLQTGSKSVQLFYDCSVWYVWGQSSSCTDGKWWPGRQYYQLSATPILLQGYTLLCSMISRTKTDCFVIVTVSPRINSHQ